MSLSKPDKIAKNLQNVIVNNRIEFICKVVAIKRTYSLPNYYYYFLFWVTLEFEPVLCRVNSQGDIELHHTLNKGLESIQGAMKLFRQRNTDINFASVACLFLTISKLKSN